MPNKAIFLIWDTNTIGLLHFGHTLTPLINIHSLKKKLICDTRKNTVVECPNLHVKNNYIKLIKLEFKFRTVSSQGQSQKEEG